MTTTPTVWDSEFTANDGETTGGQFSPVTIGLADGRFLTIWVDDGNNVDVDAGTDLVGQIFDAEGNPSGAAFQLNNNFFLDNETDPAIAALPDGGFVIVFEDNGSGTGGDAAIRFERYDASGAHVFGGTIANGSIGGITDSNPSISVLANGDFVVSYQEVNAGDTDVIAKVVNGATNAVGPALNAGQNSADVDADPDTVILSNGNILTVYEEVDAGVTGIEAKIITTAGTQVSNVQIASAGNDAHAAALTGGGFVAVWQDTANAGDIRAEVRDNTGGIVALNFLVQGGANSQNEPEVIGLKDGGFFVVWDDDTLSQLRGQRFSATGTTIGTTFTIATGGAISEPELGLTDDGRILVTFDNAVGEISQVILDPRDNVITGDNTSETITSRIDGATVDGSGGSDTLLGQGAADTLLGGSSSDVLTGGGGDDLLQGGLSKDTVDGGDGNDTIRVLEGEFGDDVTGGAGTDLLDLSFVTSRGATVDLNAGTWDFNPSFGGPYTIASVENVIGTALADTITGNSSSNALSGGGGNDTLSAGSGLDTLNGGDGDDLLLGGFSKDTVDGGNGNDIIRVLDGEFGDDITGGAGTDLLDLSFFTSRGASVDLSTGIWDFTPSFGGPYTIGGVENVTGTTLADTITGDAAANLLTGGAGNDTMTGNDGNDVLNGEQGNDSLAGGAGDDTMTGSAGTDALNGGAGADSLNGGAAGDSLNGGGGANDTVSYSDSGAGVTVNLTTNTANGGAAVGDTITGFENVTGSSSADILTGSAGANRLTANGGDDTLDGRGGNDILDGGNGIDNLTGGAGSDTFILLPQTVNRDIITDFQGIDILQISASSFGGGLVAGALNPAQFVSNATGIAGDLDDRLIYNNTTGDLFFDINGSAGGGSRLIASFIGTPALNAGDFTIVG